jgi:2-polyprenyl-6-methoxyphenol hydroxylase-like FAD-dependent oxidoreductase
MAGEKDTVALIVGAGVAGLTQAIALRRYGIDSLIFDQADDVVRNQTGSGLHLGYNATRALEHLDLLDGLVEQGGPVGRFEFKTYEGKHLGTTPGLEGELALGVLRPVLHEYLVNAVGTDKLQYGAELVRFEQDNDGVTAHFADGRTARGDVLVGADGLRSVVRTQLLGESEPQYAGYNARRGVVETELAGDRLHRNFLGRGQRFKSHPVTRERVYWTASINQPAGGFEIGADLKRTVLERYEGWPEPIQSLVEATDDSNTFFTDTYDRDPVERWGEGRVTLLGDAAHPMTWDRGQGACQGMEGAVFLAQRLADAGDDPVAALRDWEAERIPRTKRIVGASRRSGSMEQAEKPFQCFIRNRIISVVTNGFFYKRAHRDLQVEYSRRAPSRLTAAARMMSMAGGWTWMAGIAG